MIVVGTDGLFDNLSDSDIASCIAGAKSRHTAARELASEAFSKSVTRTAETPFALAATDEYNMWYTGGKQDDITVVIAFIS